MNDNNQLSTSDAETVLVVEDNPDLLELAQNLLTGLGYHVLTAKDGVSALKIVEETDSIALLLTDVVMPGELNGPSLVKRAREYRPDLKIIYMSGYAADNIDVENEDHGIPFLLKPFRRAELADLLHDVLGS